ncbi:conserved hypothetical protein [uncultured Desulfobacterium sp.]|uniref:Helicase ATP-binding domain-containing protein n=1 Tax=uncultured Desulfobacterium sp. TaxID=201089 RepID=A0A445MZ66_9BACT|nr:conserved hypothetical protein [uncultured Desulfobacterium sp.]
MTNSAKKTDTTQALSRLKVFQKKTVDHVFRRLYEGDAKRFLIADEVGLGKTLVARGVVARAIDHLWKDLDELRRIDIVYICSNGDIARQNINRLNVFDSDDGTEERHDREFATRLTLLPLYLKDLDRRQLNFISLTPGTSFNKRSNGGIAKERELIYHMLREEWGFGYEKAPMNILQYGVQNSEAWRANLKKFETHKIDKGLQKAFLKDLKKHKSLYHQFIDLKQRFYRVRKYIPQKDRELQREFIGEIRRILANACIKKLEPDIVILDEFQRFRHLMENDDEAAKLAKALFNYKDARILLLSATPFKPYTRYQEIEGENHYEDFLKTLQFLFDSDEETAACKEDLLRLGEALYRVGKGDGDDFLTAKAAVENRLQRVMVRTERLSIDADRNGMLEDVLEKDENLERGDLISFSTLDSIAQTLKAGDTVEYWKSAPYILNTMGHSGYVIKKRFLNSVKEDEENNSQIVDAINGNSNGLLSWQAIESYQKVDPGNARMRTLFSNTVEKGAWQLLWIPPSLPYYSVPSGPYAKSELKDFSKILVFSSWKIVPKVISMLASYEAERQMFDGSMNTADPATKNYSGEYSNKSRLLALQSVDGRPERMNNMVLFYPCLTLATQIDPLALSLDMIDNGQLPSMQRITDAIKERLRTVLAPIIQRHAHAGRKDQRWYWAAPALIDRYYKAKPMRAWLETEDEDLSWYSIIAPEYVNEFRRIFDSSTELGEPPDDLYELLTKIALSSPATATLRSILRVVRKDELAEIWPAILGNAAMVANGFQTLFNLPNVIAMLRGMHSLEESRYWETVLDYCTLGNLQSVLDEYCHILIESLGLMDKSAVTAVEDMAEEMYNAISIQTVNLDLDEITADPQLNRITLTEHSMRCRFALRFGDGKGDGSVGDEKAETRKEQVRQAFNSPFWPFVIASTSIGQEGLDFHQYCLNVFHWNLPGNPVDLEQREGRVHRFKGHAIRKNISYNYPLSNLVEEELFLKDPWALLFDLAKKDALKKGFNDELVPFWIYPNGQYKIRRYAPVFPFSKETDRMQALRKSLVTYRMVLGQSRQEDLVNYLNQKFEKESLDQNDFLKYRIDLSPR